MKQTKLLMGMPITIELADPQASLKNIKELFSYFKYIDTTFSTYKKSSEISKINNKLLNEDAYSQDMKTVFRLSEQTKQETNGYFNILHKGKYDPSGLVKGWAVYQASQILKKHGLHNFYVDAGGDVQVSGKNSLGKIWKVGIRNPFQREELIKILALENKGIATSGTYVRGQHIYNPHEENIPLTEIISITVIGPNVYEADRFATAAFAMGRKGIQFIEKKQGFEAYMIDKFSIATYTSGFNNYVVY